MRRQIPALICAAAIILVAVASQAGLLSEKAAWFLILILPAIAWPAISRRRDGECKKVEG